jgi:hypothetical protein
MGEPFKVDYIWAGFCMIGAVYFMFRHWQDATNRNPLAPGQVLVGPPI